MTTLQLLSLVVTTAALFAWVSQRYLRLPMTIGTMILTVLVSLALRAGGMFFPGLQVWAAHLLQQINFDQLILHGMLSLLLFAGAFLLDFKSLWGERLLVATLAVPGTILSAGLVAAGMHYGLGSLGVEAGWRSCLLFGALISPTDPIAVLEMLRRVGVSRALQAQLAGESLFNDGIGAVLFLVLLGMKHGTTVSPGAIAGQLVVEVGGALVLAVSAAWVTSALMHRVKAYQVDILLTLSLALGGYAVAQLLDVSAPLEAVVAALALRRFNQQKDPEFIAHESIDRFWEVLDEVQNAVLFVLLGLEVLAISFTHSTFAAGVLAVVSVLLVRVAVVASLLLLLRVWRRSESSVAVLSWGGLHGGLSLALALSVPSAEAPFWLVPATYLVVLFSVVVQGGSMPLLLRRFRLAAPPGEVNDVL